MNALYALTTLPPIFLASLNLPITGCFAALVAPLISLCILALSEFNVFLASNNGAFASLLDLPYLPSNAVTELLAILISDSKVLRSVKLLLPDKCCNLTYKLSKSILGGVIDAYILLKSGKTEQIEEDLKTPFINSCINYDPVKAINNIVYLNNYNKGIRSLDLNDDELTEFFYEMLNNLDNYDYYMSDLHDIYVIDMGDTAGYYYGLDTNYISIKCEQGTHNIHLIEPTLKKINATKYQGKVRIRTDIVED